MQGEFRVALHMCLDALQGRPLPASAPATPVAAPPAPPITQADTDALMARFKARGSLSCYLIESSHEHGGKHRPIVVITIAPSETPRKRDYGPLLSGCFQRAC